MSNANFCGHTCKLQDATDYAYSSSWNYLQIDQDDRLINFGGLSRGATASNDQLYTMNRGWSAFAYDIRNMQLVPIHLRSDDF